MSFIEIRDFSYTYPGRDEPALKGVNLDIDRGQLLVITGKSGCGKSTLAKALAGFLFQDEVAQFAGEIWVNETDMTQIPLYAASERVAYVQQNPEDQFCTLTVQDEIAFGLENRKVPSSEIAARIENALAVVHGTDLMDRDLATLSGGEKQKIAISSMLALSPDVLILDEPTSNLDPAATQHTFETLHTLARMQGLTIIIIEHKLQQLADLNPKVIVMDQGQCIGEETVTDFLASQDRLDENLVQGICRPKFGTKPEPVLSLSGLGLTLNQTRIFEDIDLDLYPGQFVGLLGPNGSGKTSLLRSMMGLLPPTEGSKYGFGRDLSTAKVSDLVQEMGFIFQNPDHQLFTVSIREEALFTLANLGLLTERKEAEAMTWLERLGLSEDLDRHPQTLSYGEKRRLNLVGTILHDPKILLIDEMLIGQDLENAVTWLGLLRGYCLRGNTVLLVNHHPDLTSRYCDRVLFMDGGQIKVDRRTDEAFAEITNLGFNTFTPQIQAGGQLA
jgi:energy-coupling factor transport system ATP-binding protein